jgi:hypothetical protein
MNSRNTNSRDHGHNRSGTANPRRVPVALGLGLATVATCGLIFCATGWAADPASSPAKMLAVRSTTSPADDLPAADSTVEMFAAMKSGDVEVKFIPKDDREARISIKNKTKRPLTVQLPAKFAAVPVLAQAGRGGMNGMNGGMGGMNQGMGGGMGGGMMGGGGGMMGGGGGMGGGMFNVPAETVEDIKTVRVPPDKSVHFKVATVCLEYGKRDPKPSIPYEMRPLESLTTKPGVAELLTLLGNGRIGQRSAQAAAWHLANDVTWEHLASKRIETLLGDGGSYFSPDQISTGLQVAEVSLAAAKYQAPGNSPETANSNSAETANSNSAEKKSPGEDVGSAGSADSGKSTRRRAATKR